MNSPIAIPIMPENTNIYEEGKFFHISQKLCDYGVIAKFVLANSLYLAILIRTRTKASIRYAKENDKEKRERRKERERKIEGEI